MCVISEQEISNINSCKNKDYLMSKKHFER